MEREFCDMPGYIFNNVTENIESGFDSMRLKTVIETTEARKYNLVITGSIGAGKSTISQILSTILKKCCKYVISYPEYISLDFNNRPIGRDIFDMCMNKKISTSTFQNFVIDIWKTMFEENEYNISRDGLTINIFERLPHDAVFCFSKEQVGKSMSEDEYKTIYDKYSALETNYGIPTYENCKLKKVSNDSNIYNTVLEILDIIYEDILHNTNMTRVIGLVISEDKYKQRIKERGRESEEKYEDMTLLHYNQYYSQLFDMIEQKGVAEIVDVRRTSSAYI